MELTSEWSTFFLKYSAPIYRRNYRSDAKMLRRCKIVRHGGALTSRVAGGANLCFYLFVTFLNDKVVLTISPLRRLNLEIILTRFLVVRPAFNFACVPQESATAYA